MAANRAYVDRMLAADCEVARRDGREPMLFAVPDGTSYAEACAAAEHRIAGSAGATA